MFVEVVFLRVVFPILLLVSKYTRSDEYVLKPKIGLYSGALTSKDGSDPAMSFVASFEKRVGDPESLVRLTH